MSKPPKSLNAEKNPLEELAVVYVLYFDEAQGHVPLLIFPDDSFKDDKNYMRPIRFHPIWFLGIDEQEALDHIDLEFKGYTFFGKKFLTKSGRKKRRAGLKEETPETIVIIVSLPTKLEIFGDNLIREITEKIKKNFENKLFLIIESEILQSTIIKTPQINKVIEEGSLEKAKLRDLIEDINDHFFTNVIKQSDTRSIKMQKAIAYLALKGIDVAHIDTKDYKDSFSSIQLFDPLSVSEPRYVKRGVFSFIKVEITEDSEEIEILVRNNNENELNDLNIKITHIKEYFEQEVMNQYIDIWFPKEELIFISPIIPLINEYLFFIVEEKSNKRLFSQRIDLNVLKKSKLKSIR
ncbi:MAG: hypothetical protein ACXACC_01415 [Promethearchaeota archaeon]